MPTYDYICEDGHVTEQQGGYDDSKITCYHLVDCRSDSTVCGKIARRQAVYRSQGVIFKGDGFTRSVIVPDAPLPTSTAKLTTSERMEVLDDYAKETHRYDTETLPYKKEERDAHHSS